jgi:hypothetical protein
MDKQLITALIDAGLPFDAAGERLRDLTPHERNEMQAIEISLRPDDERERDFKKRPDLRYLADKLDQDKSEQPLRADLRDNYRDDLATLRGIIDGETASPDIIALAKIVRRIYKLQARMIRADKE